VFGNPKEESPELRRLRAAKWNTEGRLANLEQEPVPTVALYRQRHTQRLGRLRKYLKDLEEAIRLQETTDVVNN